MKVFINVNSLNVSYLLPKFINLTLRFMESILQVNSSLEGKKIESELASQNWQIYNIKKDVVYLGDMNE